MLKYRTKAKINPNYHVILDKDWHQYSIPHQYIGKDAVIVYDGLEVEIFIGNKQRIDVHKHDFRRNGYTTLLNIYWNLTGDIKSKKIGLRKFIS